MHRLRTPALAVVAVFAMSAVAATAALAALPEIVNNAGKELAKKTVTTEDKEKSFLENNEADKIECTSSSSKGMGEGTKKIVKTVVRYKGCGTPLVGECKTEGAEKEEMVTSELEGEIGYISKTEKTVGLDLWPTNRTKVEKEKHEFKAMFVKFECSISTQNEVRGSVIAKMAPTNKKVKPTESFTLKYAKGAKAGEQEIKKLEGVEGGVEDTLQSSLNGGAFKPSNQQTTEKLKFEEEAEVKA